MSSIVCGGRGSKGVSFGKQLLHEVAGKVAGAVAVFALASASAGCMSSATNHDAHAQNASGQTGMASADSNNADSEARADWRTGGAGQAAADRSTRQAERSDGPGNGPDPLPWTPTERAPNSSIGNAGTTNQRILRLTPPSNNQR